MEKNQFIKITSAVVFAVTVVLFISFFIYMGLNENVTIVSPRHSPYYGRIINLTPETVEDSSAPMGTRTVYNWLMDAHCETGDFLCFYVSNHHVEVSVDGEMIYTLYSSEENPVGRSVSSNWCIIPLQPEDAGKQFTVRLTPLIADILLTDVEFMIGSDYNIVLGQLRADTLQLILAMLCISLGVIIFLIQAYLQSFTGASQWDLMFLGVFSIILGVWRITDVRSAPLIFAGNPKLLGYISVGMLFLGAPALLQFVSVYFQERQSRHLHIMTMMASAVGLFALGSQVFGTMDMEESRHMSHVVLVAGMVMVVIASFYGRKNSSSAKKQLTWKLLPLLIIGFALDIFVLYIRRDSSGLIYTCLFFLLYLSLTFVSGFQETSKMIYRDPRTDLFNKARWNELMQSDRTDYGFVGILVVDMNGLKKVNDTFGHEAGDRMIFAFADILKNSLPSSSIICRWGGDEFVIMFPQANRMKMDQYTNAIIRATEEYNLSNPEVKLSFAMGDALSEEHPEMTRPELFRLADANMYQNKHRWYAEKEEQESAETQLD